MVWRFIGHYEGGELVVDTIGFNDKTLLDDNYSVPAYARSCMSLSDTN